MNRAGLDIATRSGLAIMSGQTLIHAEAFRPKGDTDSEIFNGFRSWLRPMLLVHEVQHVGAEQPLPTNIEITEEKEDLAGRHKVKRNPITMNTYLRIYGLFGHAAEICFALNIPFHTIHQGTWRKDFIGSGRADKDDAVARCKTLGIEVKSKDAAEAIGVCWSLGKLLGAVDRNENDLFRGAA